MDIVYVLTGRRSESAWLETGASELLTAYLALPGEMQQALEAFVRALRDQYGRPSAATLHARNLDYRATGDR